jgi:hypothetical protein
MRDYFHFKWTADPRSESQPWFRSGQGKQEKELDELRKQVGEYSTSSKFNYIVWERSVDRQMAFVGGNAFYRQSKKKCFGPFVPLVGERRWTAVCGGRICPQSCARWCRSTVMPRWQLAKSWRICFSMN